MNKAELVKHLRWEHPEVLSVQGGPVRRVVRLYTRDLLELWHAQDHERHPNHPDPKSGLYNTERSV